MKKIVLVMFAMVLIGTSVSALEFNIGPKIAIGDYGFRGSDWRTQKDIFGYKDKMSASFAGGVFVNPQFTPLFGLQVEALYTRASFRYGDSSNWIQYSFNSFTIPVYARVSFKLGRVGIFALAGPRMDILFGNVKFKDDSGATAETSLADTNYRAVHIGAGLGGGVTLPAGPGKLDIGLVYNTTFTKMVDVASPPEMYPEGLEIQLGYAFSL